jgi:hypothetical protein
MSFIELITIGGKRGFSEDESRPFIIAFINCLRLLDLYRLLLLGNAIYEKTKKTTTTTTTTTTIVAEIRVRWSRSCLLLCKIR